MKVSTEITEKMETYLALTKETAALFKELMDWLGTHDDGGVYLSLMRDKRVTGALDDIIAAGEEAYALQALSKNLHTKLSKTSTELNEARAALRAIKKINNGKNEAIDAFCE